MFLVFLGLAFAALNAGIAMAVYPNGSWSFNAAMAVFYFGAALLLGIRDLHRK